MNVKPGIRPPDNLTPPHCAAIAGQLYIIYMPRGNRSVSLKLIELNESRYRADWCDPRTGRLMPVDDAPAGQTEWAIPERPSPSDEDWVLVVAMPH